MTNDPQRQRGDGVSRREFVQGRFWKALRGTDRSAAKSKPDSDAEVPPALVMRYPTSIDEVSAGDGATTSASSIPDTSARRRTIPVLRPPGAIDEASFLAGCTRCGDCLTACPHDAIIHAPERLREAAGTPMIEADHQACMMCEDFPCIAACQPGVLTSSVPPMMGTAKVTEHLCLAHHGTTCTVCIERCPLDAIDLDQGKPKVREADCTGCGVCRYVCVAPENAILLMPAFARPSPPRDTTDE